MHKTIDSIHFSYWELQQFFRNIDLIVVGSGIVGLSAALSFKQQHKKAKVVILERGILPYGASTKNAGFACFGSMSELLADIKNTNETSVLETVEMRYKGLNLLRKRLGDKRIDYKEWGGYELFDTPDVYNYCLDNIDYLNKQLHSIIGAKNSFKPTPKKIDQFGFKTIQGLIKNTKEGQIDTGLMMKNYLELVVKNGVTILNNIDVKAIQDTNQSVVLQTSIGEITAKQCIVANNGFAKELLSIKDIEPARAQVLITKPISNLNLKGTFHYQEGFYYFRNIHNRLLFGGGRHLDFKSENSTEFKLTPKIQKELERLLSTIILPDTPYEIEHRWCGIMGIGSEKKPIIQKTSTNVICAVRMGGMGVAIGSLVGKMAVDKLVS